MKLARGEGALQVHGLSIVPGVCWSVGKFKKRNDYLQLCDRSTADAPGVSQMMTQGGGERRRFSAEAPPPLRHHGATADAPSVLILLIFPLRSLITFLILELKVNRSYDCLGLRGELERASSEGGLQVPGLSIEYGAC